MENSGQNRFCPHCGSPVNQGQSFCGNCGKAITAVQQSVEAKPQQSSDSYAQNINPYASQQTAQNTNPYASQQTVQNTNPYASQQTAQNTNPYASQQTVQNTNPYASQKTVQNTNSYASQQTAQNTNPYASQQTAQNTNPYAPQQTAQDNNVYGQQSFNPYSSAQPTFHYNNGMVTTQSDFTEPKKRSKKPFIIAGSAVVGVAAVAVAAVLVFNALKPSGGPITRIADGTKSLAKANSATLSLSASYQGTEIAFNGSYEIDREKKEVVAAFDGTATNESSLSEYSDSLSDQSFKMIIYCKDGIRRAGASNSGSEMRYTEIDQEDLDKFFEGLNNTDEPDWNSLDIDDELSKYIYTDKIEEVSDALVYTFENGEGKEALGITETPENGGTKFNFDIKLYDTAKVAVDTVEPLFKDKTQYSEIKSKLADAKSTLDSINLKFDISLDSAGNLSGFNFDSFGFKASLSIKDIGNAKVQISEAEINDLKNAEVGSSSSSSLYDRYENSYLDY